MPSAAAMDANHPVTLVLCVITAFVTVVAVGHFAERWIRPSHARRWPTVVFFAVAALAFGAGAFLPEVSVRALAVAVFLFFAYGSLGTAFHWPGFRPQPAQDEEDDELEGDERDDEGGTQLPG
jgi:heme A synthase